MGLPRPQAATENCTVHNDNIVPPRSGRYVAVGGHYQAGTWAVEFTDPAFPRTVAWSDSLPLPTNEAGGAWSSYYYNNFVSESDITRDLEVFRISDRVMAGALRLPYLNPQTQDFTVG